MKAFKEWWKAKRGTIKPYVDVYWQLKKEHTKTGWKAALEWVREELCPGNGKSQILEDIEKELEGE